MRNPSFAFSIQNLFLKVFATFTLGYFLRPMNKCYKDKKNNKSIKMSYVIALIWHKMESLCRDMYGLLFHGCNFLNLMSLIKGDMLKTKRVFINYINI